VTATVSLLPQMTGSNLPPANPIGLTDDEQRLIGGLSTKLTFQSTMVELNWLYYDGSQRMANLGISVPPVLAGIRTVVDWPRICVDPLVQRCILDGFRLPGATDIDTELAEHLQANDFDGEAPLAFLDALVAGRGYMIVGSPDTPGDSPLVTIESPLNLTMTWDPRSRRVQAAYQSYEAEGVYRAALYLPDQSIFMSRRDNGGKFGEVPVVRLPNRSRSSDREGRSQITAPVKNTTDSACRSLLGMEIAREFYSVPHKYILGAAESDFQDEQGNAKSAWDMAMNKFLAIERDEDGNVPQLGQFQAFDPSVFTKIIDEHAQLMASFTGFPPAYFGQTTTANPASADAIRVAENGIDRSAQQKQQQFTAPLRQVAQLVWRFAHDGAELPDEMRKLGVDWVDAATPTPAATTDATVKQVQAGIIPATSDVTLAKLNYSAAQRARLEQDRKLDQAAQLESELTASLAARQARSGNAIANDLEAAAAPPAPPRP
jgi:hypothetical protein